MYQVTQQFSSKISRKGLPSLSGCYHIVEIILSNLKFNKDQKYSFVIRYVDRAESAALNSHYRGKEGPTNVLSFTYDQFKELKLPVIGDIVISVPIAKKEAKEYKLSTANYCARLIIHGILHVLGYEHDSSNEARKMEALEKKIYLKYELEKR